MRDLTVLEGTFCVWAAFTLPLITSIYIKSVVFGPRTVLTLTPIKKSIFKLKNNFYQLLYIFKGQNFKSLSNYGNNKANKKYLIKLKFRGKFKVFQRKNN